MNRIKRDSLDNDDKNIDTVTQLRLLIKKALKEGRNAQLEKRETVSNVRQSKNTESNSRSRKLTEGNVHRPKHQEQTEASMRRTSLTAVFKIAGLKALGKLGFENKT